MRLFYKKYIYDILFKISFINIIYYKYYKIAFLHCTVVSIFYKTSILHSIFSLCGEYNKRNRVKRNIIRKECIKKHKNKKRAKINRVRRELNILAKYITSIK